MTQNIYHPDSQIPVHRLFRQSKQPIPLDVCDVDPFSNGTTQNALRSANAKERRSQQKTLVNEALEYARRAVEFDQQILELRSFEQFIEMARGYRDAAVEAYGRCVGILRGVLREMEVEIEMESRKGVERQGGVGAEGILDLGKRREEVRRMRTILAKYETRMGVLQRAVLEVDEAATMPSNKPPGYWETRNSEIQTPIILKNGRMFF
ncbi:hypothetical protein CPC08DRAFT_713842 [Agrocybe pediades]|nr:hypothetical protein CPC08DRAFT_713842 [Agrocybe pediades]